MVNENKTWFLDFSEKGQMWHIDLERVPENDSWVNIGYGRYEVLSYFCDMVDVLTSEFKMHLTPEQVLRLAECTPGDSSGLNVPPVSLSNVPGVSETNVPPISGTNVPGISL